MNPRERTEIDHNGMRFTVRWSPEDQSYVATVDKYPSLSWLSTTERRAVKGLFEVVQDVEKDLFFEWLDAVPREAL